MRPCTACGTIDRNKFDSVYARYCIACKAKLYELTANSPRKNRTHCRRGHEYTPENTRFQYTNGKVQRCCIACDKQRTSGSIRARHIKSKYGLTIEEYNALLQAQGNVCAACKYPFTYIRNGKPESYHVDHDHKTDKVRGLLCGDCNRALGYLKDDPERIKGLLEYVLKW